MYSYQQYAVTCVHSEEHFVVCQQSSLASRIMRAITLQSAVYTANNT